MQILQRSLMAVGALAVAGGLVVAGASLTSSQKRGLDPSLEADLLASRGPRTESAPAGPSVIAVDAGELHRRYAANEIAADRVFKGREILVRGVVESIDKNAFDEPYLSLATGETFSSVHAELDDSVVDRAATLARGVRVTLRCVGSGRLLGSAMLKGCRFA